MVFAAPALHGAPRKTEAELLQMLKSPDYQKVIDALDRLPNWYPSSTNAIAAIKEVLKSKRSSGKGVPANILHRKAARALGDYGAELTLEEIRIVWAFLRAYDPDEVMDGLKSLRGFKEPDAINKTSIEQLVPLLQDENRHVVRDSCRTLAVIGNKDVIQSIEPLLKHRASDVRQDARNAIAKLSAKP
jgi:HEAT repeat protein